MLFNLGIPQQKKKLEQLVTSIFHCKVDKNPSAAESVGRTCPKASKSNPSALTAVV